MNKSKESKQDGIPIKEAMYAGNRKCILHYLASDNDYGQAMAIGACVKNRYTDEEVFHLLEALENSKGRPMGISIRALAIAAMHELGLKEYVGKDRTIQWMIEDHFAFALEDKRHTTNNGEKYSPT